jgi:hypothetical protein
MSLVETPPVKQCSPGKICGICCGVTTPVVIILGLVGFFAIIPNMAESNLAASTLTITNGTVILPSNTLKHPWVWQNITADMHNAAPFGVTMKAFTQTMTIFGDYTPLGGGDHSEGLKIASFEFPEQHLKPGDNTIHATVNMSLMNQKKCGDGLTCFGAFETVVGFAGKFPGIPYAYVTIAGTDMKLKSMGLPVHGSYNKAFKMSCNSDGQAPKESINTSTYQPCIDAGGCQGIVMMNCSQVEEYHLGTTTTTTETKMSATITV